MGDRIVVGVDGSDGSLRALRWAVGEAQLRGTSLEVVHAWAYAYMGDAIGTADFPVDVDREKDEQALLDRCVDTVRSTAKEVRIQPHLVFGGAASALLEAAHGADLLVVGSRGRGGFAGLLLGSVSQQCTHHARCPVVVVPTEDGE